MEYSVEYTDIEEMNEKATRGDGGALFRTLLQILRVRGIDRNEPEDRTSTALTVKIKKFL